MTHPRIVVLTLLAMLAFAGNSLLCRLALRGAHVDAASFTMIRLAAGAVVLWLIVRWRGGGAGGHGSWRSALALFAYAAAFSYAYLSLTAAMGALLLFGAVQATMIGAGLWQGERLAPVQFAGLVLAGAGLVGLLAPGLEAPPLAGATLMIIAGIAWGIYSLRGRQGGNALASTAGNFLRAAPFGVALGVAGLALSPAADAAGIGYAIASGALASGLGYAIWYTALPGLRATSAASVQLSVPAITAFGGVLFLDEVVTLRLLLASAAILGGIALVIAGRVRPARR